MTRRRVPTKEQIDFMIKSKEGSQECAIKVGYSAATVCKYRRLYGYGIKHYKFGDKEAVKFKQPNMSNPANKFLYGAIV